MRTLMKSANRGSDMTLDGTTASPDIRPDYALLLQADPSGRATNSAGFLAPDTMAIGAISDAESGTYQLYALSGGGMKVNSYVGATQEGGSAVTKLSDGSYVVTWSNAGEDGSSSGVFMQRYDSAGQTLGSETRVNTYTVGNQFAPHVAALSGGGYVVTWGSFNQGAAGGGVYMQRYDTNGVAQGSETEVGSHASFSHFSQTVTALTGGGYVVAWDSSGQDGSADGIYMQRYDANGVAQGSETLVNTYTTGYQGTPSIGALTNGGYVVTWISADQPGDAGSGVYMQRYDANGVAQGAETHVNTYAVGDQSSQSVTGLAGGDFVVTWTSLGPAPSYGYGQNNTGYNVFMQRYTASGVAVGGETLVSPVAGNGFGVNVTALANGGFVIGWAGQDATFVGHAYAQFFDSLSVAQGSAAMLGLSARSETAPHLIELNDHSVVAVWDAMDRNGANPAIIAQHLVSTAGPTAVTLSSSTIFEAEVSGAAPVTFATSGAANGGYSYTILADNSGGAFGVSGNGLVVLDNRLLDHETAPTVTLTVRSTDVNGNSVDQQLVLNIADNSDETRFAFASEAQVNTTSTGDQTDSAVTALAGGGYVVTWSSDGQDGSGLGVYAQRYDAGGVAVGSETHVSTFTTGDQKAPTAAGLTGGGYVVAWTSNGQDGSGYGVYAQRYDASGVAVGGETRINSYTANDQSMPTVTGLSGGGYVVSWVSNGQDGGGLGIYAQRYDANGVAQGAETKVNTYFTGQQTAPSIAALANGGYVVAWDSDGEDGSSTGIYLQRYDANGVAQGSETRANTLTNGSQYAASVIGLAGGGFVVSWQSNAHESSGLAVILQRFDANGVAVGSEVHVNTYTLLDQQSATVTALADGGYAVLWDSFGEDGNANGVYMQRYDANGVAQGGETLINATSLGIQTMPSVATLANGNIVAAWTDGSHVGGDVSGYAIRDRILTLTGPLTADLNGIAPGRTAALAYTENDVATVIAPHATVSGAPANLNGGSLTVAFAAGGTSADQLAILNQGNGAGQIGIAGGVVSYGGVAIGTVSGGANGAPLVVTFTSANATGAALEALVHVVAFSNNSDDPSTAGRSVQFTVNDGHGGSFSSGLTATIGVTAVDDPAVAVDDTITTANVAIVGASVFTNDHDLDGALVVASVNGSAASVGQQITLASGALLTLRADGHYDYDPNHAFANLTAVSGATNSTATDSFTYALVGGGSATVTVTITGDPASGNHALGSAGNDTLIGSGSADYFDLSQGGNDHASGGVGEDAFFLGAAFTAGDQIDGGVGINDQLGLQGNYTGGNALVLGAGTISGIEVISVLPGFSYDITTNDGNVAAGETLKIFGTTLGAGDNLTFDGSAETDGKFLVYGGLGADHITTGAGVDGIYFGRDGRFDPLTDHVDGGGGNDQMALDGNYTVTISNASVTNVEMLVLLDDSAPHNQYDITLADDWTAAGQTQTVYGVTVRDGFTIDASAESNGNIKVYGGQGSDHITTGAGNDWIMGGAGADVLKGNGGSDTFFYNKISDSIGSSHDIIVGFDATADKIDLPTTVTGIDAALNAGNASTATLDADLTAALAGLHANHAITFTASGGDLAGHIFEVIDTNGIAGYQAGQDMVIELQNPVNQITTTAPFI